MLASSISGASNSSKTRSAPASVACRVFTMLAIWAIGRVNERMYWVKAWISPTATAPASTCAAPITHKTT